MNKSKILRALKCILPPFIVKLANRMAGETRYHGNYPDWQAAIADSTSYSEEKILKRVTISARKVKEGLAVFERDSVLFYEESFNWALIAACFMASHKRNLNVLDYGGSLGSSYYQNKKILNNFLKFKWMIVEQYQYVIQGQQEFADDNLNFYFSLDELPAIDIAILGGVLEYLEFPYRVLKQIASLSPAIIYIDRTPFTKSSEDRLTVQHVNKKIYKGSYPAWFFSKSRFLREIREIGYKVLTEYITDDTANINCEFQCLILEKYNEKNVSDY